MAARLAIYQPAGNFGLRENLFGADVANLGLVRALAAHGGLAQLDLLGAEPPDLKTFIDGLPQGLTTRLVSGEIMNQSIPAAAGTLLRGGPDLADLAWLRRRGAGDRGYSLAGLIQTIAPHAMREMIAAAAIAPLHDWDALICTSPSVQAALMRLFDEWGDYLGDRFGGRRRTRPRLPLIPLGVDQAALQARAQRPQVRAQTRAALGLSEDEALVLWVGRLSFFEKAYPQPMFRALEAAVATTGRRLHFAMAGWFPNGEADRARYQEAAAAYAPSIQLHLVDGNDQEGVGALWAASDVFLSLVDNIQETFGITPIEAMAAGLPVVVSDWDGYRSTVRHGLDGFLVPTLGAPGGGLGHPISLRHMMKLDAYQTYVGAVAQHTAVHVGRAAEAIAALASSPDLRARMGASGRERVREAFDWRVVARSYADLIDELAAVRAAAADPPRTPAMHPAKGDPFTDFAGFASAGLTLDTRLSLASGASTQDLARTGGVVLDRMFSGWRGTPEEDARALARIADGGATVREVLLAFPVDRRRAVELSLVWMAKLGMIDWLA